MMVGNNRWLDSRKYCASVGEPAKYFDTKNLRSPKNATASRLVSPTREDVPAVRQPRGHATGYDRLCLLQSNLTLGGFDQLCRIKAQSSPEHGHDVLDGAGVRRRVSVQDV